MAARKKTERKVKAARAPKAQAQVEVVEIEGGGMGLDDGIVLATALLLAGALVLAWVALSGYPAAA